MSEALEIPILTCWIKESELQILAADATERRPKETGGLLIGYWANEREVVLVTTTKAGPKAIHTKYTYDPDVEFDTLIVSQLFIESHGTHTYLGDWHSHPDGPSSLSSTDRKALSNIARSKAARVRIPLMAIVWGKKDDWKISVWYRAPNKLRFFSTYLAASVRFY